MLPNKLEKLLIPESFYKVQLAFDEAALQDVTYPPAELYRERSLSRDVLGGQIVVGVVRNPSLDGGTRMRIQPGIAGDDAQPTIHAANTVNMSWTALDHRTPFGIQLMYSPSLISLWSKEKKRAYAEDGGIFTSALSGQREVYRTQAKGLVAFVRVNGTMPLLGHRDEAAFKVYETGMVLSPVENTNAAFGGSLFAARRRIVTGRDGQSKSEDVPLVFEAIADVGTFANTDRSARGMVDVIVCSTTGSELSVRIEDSGIQYDPAEDPYLNPRALDHQYKDFPGSTRAGEIKFNGPRTIREVNLVRSRNVVPLARFQLALVGSTDETPMEDADFSDVQS